MGLERDEYSFMYAYVPVSLKSEQNSSLFTATVFSSTATTPILHVGTYVCLASFQFHTAFRIGP